MKDLAILIPAYNEEKYIGNTIHSIVRQIKKLSVEIHVVDDGSSDNTLSNIEIYKRKYPDVIHTYTQQNIGLIATRKRLYSKANSKYIFCLDGGDELCDGALSKIINKLLYEEPDILLFDYLVETNFLGYKSEIKHNAFQFFDCVVSKNDYFDKLYSGEINAIWRKVFRKTLIESEINNLKPDISMGEDLYQSILFSKKANKIFYIHDELVTYRVLSSSMSRSYDKNIIKSYSNIIDLILRETPTNKSSIVKKMYNSLIYKMICNSFKANHNQMINEHTTIKALVKRYDSTSFLSEDTLTERVLYLLKANYQTIFINRFIFKFVENLKKTLRSYYYQIK